MIVSAVEEIVRDNKKENFVLVCSNSNAACDELFGRLLDVCDFHEILRLYTVSHDPKTVDPAHLKCSNWDSRMNSFSMPDLPFLYQHQVLVCTLAVASSLTRANQCNTFKADHFSHIFIDESCCAHETMTMVPIAGKKKLFKYLTLNYSTKTSPLFIQVSAPFLMN